MSMICTNIAIHCVAEFSRTSVNINVVFAACRAMGAGTYFLLGNNPTIASQGLGGLPYFPPACILPGRIISVWKRSLGVEYELPSRR
jgi:hypothetical protein